MEHTTTPNPTPRAVADVVREALADARLSLRDVANTTGIPTSTLHRRLTGTGHGFTMTELAQVAHVLQTTTSTLLARAEATDHEVPA